MRIIVLFMAVMFALPAMAETRTPMQDDPTLENGLRMVAQSYFFRKNCDQVSLRYIRGLRLMGQLKSRGRALGYSDDEMQDYFDDEHHRARVEAAARADLAARGLDFDNPETYCPVALDLVARGVGVGYYFRAR